MASVSPAFFKAGNQCLQPSPKPFCPKTEPVLCALLQGAGPALCRAGAVPYSGLPGERDAVSRLCNAAVKALSPCAQPRSAPDVMNHSHIWNSSWNGGETCQGGAPLACNVFWMSRGQKAGNKFS